MRVIKGAVLDVAVDIRKGSPTFIDWRIPAEKVVLSEKDGKHPRLKDWQNVF